MIREPVTSSNLSSVGYDSDLQVLEIEFNSGSVYQYSGVPTHIHSGLMSAPSHGSYFHEHIKDRFPFVRVE